MSAVGPVGLGLRNARRRRAHTVLLAVVVALVVSTSVVAFAVRATATFSAREAASIALGTADFQARFAGGDIAAATEPVESAGTGVVQALPDTDLRTDLRAGQRTHVLDGRVVAYDDPLTDGIVSFGERAPGPSQLALSPAAASALGVRLGDEVEVRTDGGWLGVRYTDTVRYAADTSVAYFLLTPDAVTPADVEQVLAGAISTNTTRWLIDSEDHAATASHLAEIGLSAVTPAGFTPQEVSVLVDPDLMLAAAGLVAVGVLGTATASLAAARRRQSAVLTSLGVPPRDVRTTWAVHAAVAGTAGAVLGVLLGVVAAAVVASVLARSVHQEWGRLEMPWLPVVAVALACVVGVVGISAATVPLPGRTRVAPSRATARGSGPVALLVGRRLVTRSRGLRRAGVVVIGLSVAVGAAALVTVEVAQQRAVALYEPTLPTGDGALRLERPLTPDERARVEATANVRVVQDRRVAFTTDSVGIAVPAVLESEFTRCAAAEQAVDPCLEKMTSVEGRTVAVLRDLSDVAALLGRDVTPQEQDAFTRGDGLLLAERESTVLVAPAGFTEPGADFRHPVDLLRVDGFERYTQLPAAVVSVDAMDRWGLFEDTDPAAYHVVVPQTGAIDPSVLRGALPDELGADLVVEQGPAYVDALRAVVRAVLLTSSCLVLLVVLLLVAAWAEDSASQLRALSALGAPPGMVRAALVVRSSLTVVPATAVGILLAVGAAAAFAAYAGVRFSWGGALWLLPVGSAVGGAVLAGALLAPVGSSRRSAG